MAGQGRGVWWSARGCGVVRGLVQNAEKKGVLREGAESLVVGGLTGIFGVNLA